MGWRVPLHTELRGAGTVGQWGHLTHCLVQCSVNPPRFQHLGVWLVKFSTTGAGVSGSLTKADWGPEADLINGSGLLLNLVDHTGRS